MMIGSGRLPGPIFNINIIKNKVMKRSELLLLTFIVVPALIISCNKTPVAEREKQEGKPEAAVLSTDVQSLEFEAEGGSIDVGVTTNRNVVIECSDSWCRTSFSDVDNAFVLQKRIMTVNVSAFSGGRSTKLTLSAIDCEDIIIDVLQKKTVKSTCDLLSFSLDKAINGLDKDIVFSKDVDGSKWSAKYLKWIEKASPEIFVPTFETNGDKVLWKGREVVSGKTILDLSEDIVLTVVAENGDKKDYTISLNCPQINKELAVLHLKPSSLIAGKKTYVSTDIVLYDKSIGASGKGWWDSKEKGAVSLRGRGNSTWGLPKKPFRIKFSEKFSPLGLEHAKAKSWVLLAHDMDKSLIRNHLAFEYSKILFNESDRWHDSQAILFTPCSKYINVYFTGPYYDSSKGHAVDMDGDYLGVYQLSDQMEMAKGRIAVDKLTAVDGGDPDKISGGYIIETDLHEGNHFSLSKGVKMTYKYPDDKDYDKSQYDYISNFINNAEKALYGADYKDPVNGWRRWFDEKTLADFIIVKEFVGDMDGYTSTYMYKRRGVDKLFFGPIWDCDKGWDNDKRIPHFEYRPLDNLMIKSGFRMPPYVRNDWFWRFWSDETFRAFVNNRWKSKKSELEAVTDRVLKDMPEKMRKAIEANFSVWPFSYQYSSEAKMPDATYDEEINRIRILSERRSVLLDRLFSE